ncbi:MAG: TonB-dependent receptor plug domain-containing protein [Bacteroidota bacterium]|nr:TonB-dependent receptor plug domain-containing protein [Bacteroidota bacterium]
MKKIISTSLFLSICLFNFAQDTSKHKLNDTLMLENIEVISIRAGNRAPFTKTNIDKQQIEKVNLGQDLPFVLNQLPAVVINSDAGNGVGYTGIRIRGSDASRVNVTLNGIPYNDAESQGTFFVDLPDIASSVNSIQIQRGVGTSSNGGGAFGATINLQTNEVNKERYVELNNSYGSFNTWKNTIKTGTGLLGNHFTFDARVSGISSDGYVERAKSNLQSFYISTAYINNNSSLRFNIINGKEKTYQSWYGIPESYLDSNRRYNPAGTEKPGSPYKNEMDNYTQTHYQLFYNRKINNALRLSITAFLTRGKGYYEEYRADQPYSDYGLPDYYNGSDTITSTDLVRQLWLDSYFYGTLFSVQYQKNKTQFTFGGGWNNYDGKHYDIVTWAQQGFPKNYKYADLPANKNDLNFYAKILQAFGSGFSGFIDMQGRFVNYHIAGFESNPQINIKKEYAFFNPKIGLSFNKKNFQSYVSYSVGSKEPNRDDFEAGANQQPMPEILQDMELGIENKGKTVSYGVTLYYMSYHNQLVNTGKINDVGAYTRTNAAHSYRMGAELQTAIKFADWVNVSGNISFSKNKIKNFTEYVDDYDNGGQLMNQYKNTNISFSPDIVSAATINFLPIKNSEVSFQEKYVSRQFLDNTSNTSRSIHPYLVENARFAYLLPKKICKEVNFIFQVNNVFNKKYESNGYTYNYFSGGQLNVENYYFPMAGINFLVAINIKL